MKKLIILLLCLWSCFVQAQSDPVYKRRRILLGSINGAGLVAEGLILNQFWYKNYPKSSFHFFNDGNEWLQMDKCGHAFFSYKLARVEYLGWTWAGMEPKKAAWLSAGISLGYMTTTEVLDGFSTQWGFSYPDMIANTTGNGIFLAQQLAWGDQRFQVKFSYKPSKYAKLRPDLLGSTFAERFLKDYNAQSYWISFAPGRFVNKRYFPGWLQISLGYSANEMLSGSPREFYLNGQRYYARREFAISLDLDWSQFHYKRVWVKKLLQVLNAVKVPFPAVYWRSGVCYVGMF